MAAGRFGTSMRIEILATDSLRRSNEDDATCPLTRGRSMENLLSLYRAHDTLSLTVRSNNS